MEVIVLNCESACNNPRCGAISGKKQKFLFSGSQNDVWLLSNYKLPKTQGTFFKPGTKHSPQGQQAVKVSTYFISSITLMMATICFKEVTDNGFWTLNFFSKHTSVCVILM